MKKSLINLVRKMANWPFIGRFVRFSVSIIRHPIFKKNHHKNMIEPLQLSTLLQSFSDLNHRQLINDKDKENLINSVPIALRKLTRDIFDIKTKLEKTASSVDYLLNRVKVERRELVCEIGGHHSSLNTEKVTVKAEIFNPKKLELARGKVLKINLRCGNITLDDYLNVDHRKLFNVDILAEVDQLPFESGEIDEFYSGHLLQSFTQENLRRKLLPYYFDLLKVGGVFRTVVVDSDAVLMDYVNGQCSDDDLREAMYGSQCDDESYKYNSFTSESLINIFSEVGFTDVVVVKTTKEGEKFGRLELAAIKKILEIR